MFSPCLIFYLIVKENDVSKNCPALKSFQLKKFQFRDQVAVELQVRTQAVKQSINIVKIKIALSTIKLNFTRFQD